MMLKVILTMLNREKLLNNDQFGELITQEMSVTTIMPVTVKCELNKLSIHMFPIHTRAFY